MARYTFAFLLVSLVVGCGGERSLPTEVLDKAKSGVQTALETWKKGDAPEKLSAQYVVTDHEWKAKAKLLDFTIHRTEGIQGGNARCWVTLSLRDRRGKTFQRDVVYEVNVEKAPMVIARDPMN